MKRVICVLFVAACGGGSETPDAMPPSCAEAGGAACFQLPTDVMVAHAGPLTGAAALGCGPFVPTDSTMDVTLSGTVKNYSGGAGVGGASIEIDTGADFTNPIATTTSANDGTYSMVIPSGSPDLLFGKVTASGFLDIYYGNDHPDLTQATIPNFNLSVATAAYLDTLFGLVDSTRDATKATMAVAVRDCSNFSLQHTAVVMSATSGQRDFIDGVGVFYTAAGALPLPERPADQPDTNDNGVAAVTNMPTSGATFLQVWGWPDANAKSQGEAGLVLVAEYPLTLFAGELLSEIASANQ